MLNILSWCVYPHTAATLLGTVPWGPRAILCASVLLMGLVFLAVCAVCQLRIPLLSREVEGIPPGQVLLDLN